MRKIILSFIGFFSLLLPLAHATEQLDLKAFDSEYQEILVLQYLAETQHHFTYADFKQGYENSKKALCAINFFGKDKYENLDLLFLALYQHIICCDQLDFTEECNATLTELLLISDMIVESDNHYCDYKDMDLMFFETLDKLFSFAGFVKNEHIKNTLITISKEVFLRKNNTCSSLEEIDSLQRKYPDEKSSCSQEIYAKKWWKDLHWWKKNINKLMKKVAEIAAILEAIKDILDKLTN